MQLFSKQDIQEVYNCFRNKTIESVAQGKEVYVGSKEQEAIADSINELNRILSYLPGFSSIRVIPVIKTEYGRVIELKLVTKMKLYGEKKLEYFEIDVSKEHTEYTETINKFVKFRNITDNINKHILEIQLKNGANALVRYGWGYSEYCGVKDWDYDNIVFQASKSSIDSIVALKEDYRELITDNIYCGNTIVEMVNKFNGLEMHKQCNMKMNGTLLENLTKPLLNMSDVVQIIRKNRNREGNQVIKCHTHINEAVGKFLVVHDWSVDYKNRTIDITIRDKKAYDIENDKFIQDNDTFNRISKFVQMPECSAPIIFGDKNISSYIGGV